MYYNHVLQYTMQDEYLTVWHGILSNQYANIMFNYNDDSQARAADYTLVKNLISYPFPVLPANLLIARSVGPSGALRTAIMQRPRRGEVRGLAS